MLHWWMIGFVVNIPQITCKRKHFFASASLAGSIMHFPCVPFYTLSKMAQK